LQHDRLLFKFSLDQCKIQVKSMKHHCKFMIVYWSLSSICLLDRIIYLFIGSNYLSFSKALLHLKSICC